MAYSILDPKGRHQFFSGRCWYYRHSISKTKNKLSVALCFYSAVCLVSYRIEVNLIFYLSEEKYKLQLEKEGWKLRKQRVNETVQFGK